MSANFAIMPKKKKKSNNNNNNKTIGNFMTFQDNVGK